MKREISALLLAAAAGFAFADTGRTKAMIIMVDGLRADAVENVPMTNLMKLCEGRWRPEYRAVHSFTGHTLHDARPSSAANHAAIATGVTAAKTKVFNNGETPRGDFGKWPSWLARVVEARPDVKALFAYSWAGDTALAPHPRVRSLPLISVINDNWPISNDGYERCARTIPQLMASPDAPDAVLYFIDITDWGGHRSAFYPYGKEYLNDIHVADRIIGETLDAIASRPSFKDEDWLVMVTSDHGGYRKKHGIWGGQATTIPVVVSGRRLKGGRIPGMPHNYDLPVTALAHFGLDVPSMKLDGWPIFAVAPEIPKRPLSDGLVAYLPFEGAEPANCVAGGPVPKAHGATKSGVAGGKYGKCLRVSAGEDGSCGVSLAGSESLEFENRSDFTFALWVKFDSQQAMQAPVVSNKDWDSGRNPGVVLIGARKTDAVKNPGVCFNSGRAGEEKRIDMGTFDISYGEWTFYAVTHDREGVVSVYQGGRDGNLYWIADSVPDMQLKSGFPFWIGQDGTGKCLVCMDGFVDNFALWTRALTRDEIREVLLKVSPLDK